MYLGKGGWRSTYCLLIVGNTWGRLSHHLRLHLGLHHQCSSSVRVLSPTNADSGSMESRVEHC